MKKLMLFAFILFSFLVVFAGSYRTGNEIGGEPTLGAVITDQEQSITLEMVLEQSPAVQLDVMSIEQSIAKADKYEDYPFATSQDKATIHYLVMRSTSDPPTDNFNSKKIILIKTTIAMEGKPLEGL